MPGDTTTASGGPDGGDATLGAALLGKMEARYGLPRPDWEAVYDRLDVVPAEKRGEAWGQLQRLWQRATAEAWGDGFRVLEAGGVLLNTDLPDADAQKVLPFLGQALEKIDRLLGGLGLGPVGDPAGWESYAGLDLAVVCRDLDPYLDYICDYYGEDAYEGGISGGVCIHRGDIHLVAHGANLSQLDAVLAHELSHTRLAMYGLPVWLDEGLVTHLEAAVIGQEFCAMHYDQIALHQDFWTGERLDAFFHQNGFNTVDDGFGLAYSLAHEIVRELLVKKRIGVGQLVKQADYEDGGAGACREVFGIGLMDLVPRFIRDAL